MNKPKLLLFFSTLLAISDIINSSLPAIWPSNPEDVVFPNFEPIINEGKNCDKMVVIANCTGESCIKPLTAKRKGLLNTLHTTLDNLKGAVRMENRAKITYNIGKLKEKWKETEQVHNQLEKVLLNEDQITKETEHFHSEKDQIDEAIDESERFLKNLKAEDSRCRNEDVAPPLTAYHTNNVELDMHKTLRNHLLGELRKIQAEVSNSSSFEEAKRIVNTKLDGDSLGAVWPLIVNQSIAIFDILRDQNRVTEREEEAKYQKKLMDMRARIRYQAKLRRCPSYFEAYFLPLQRCLPYDTSSDEGGYPCSVNQVLRDGPGNLGYCRCRNENGMILYTEDRQCYQQFTQGPCEFRESRWWVKTDKGYPDCEVVPEGCQADGNYVYWRHPDEVKRNSRAMKKCYKLGETGPCPTGQVISLDGLEVQCASLRSQAVSVSPIAATVIKHCWPGQSSCFTN